MALYLAVQLALPLRHHFIPGDVLWTEGQSHGMRPFGMRAMMSLRLDRFFGSWHREFSQDYTAAETGLDRFISFKKTADFIGRAAAEADSRRTRH